MTFVLTLVVLLAALIIIANVARLATLVEDTSELAQGNVDVEADIQQLSHRVAALEMGTPLNRAPRIRHVLKTPHDTESEAV